MILSLCNIFCGALFPCGLFITIIYAILAQAAGWKVCLYRENPSF